MIWGEMWGSGAAWPMEAEVRIAEVRATEVVEQGARDKSSQGACRVGV